MLAVTTYRLESAHVLQIGIAGWAASVTLGAGYLGPHSKLASLLDERSPEDAEGGAAAAVPRLRHGRPAVVVVARP